MNGSDENISLKTKNYATKYKGSCPLVWFAKVSFICKGSFPGTCDKSQQSRLSDLGKGGGGENSMWGSRRNCSFLDQ